MNEDKFIDNALKEYAQNGGKIDEDFLSELEKKIDGVEETPVLNEAPVNRRKWRAGMMSAAALILVGVVGKGIHSNFYKGDQSAPMALYNLASDERPLQEREESPVVKTGLSRKPSAPAMSEMKMRQSELGVPVLGDLPIIGGLFDQDGFTSIEEFKPGFGNHKAPNGNRYGSLIDGGFLSPLKEPLSTFSVDVDTASYTNVRKLIQSGRAVHPDAVRVEEMINYFKYDYSGPTSEHPFAIHTEVAACPWNAEHQLVKIGLQGKRIESEERKNANLVFLIDVSGSMNSANKLPLLVDSFQLLLKKLNEKDRVSLVVYAGRDAVLLQPTQVDEDGAQKISEALQKLSAGGGTNGASGIATAYDLARSGFIEDGVNRVILATDGDFNVGTTNQDELLKLVKNQSEGNISLTILGFGQGNLNDRMMEQLTNHGDGNYFYLDSLQEGQKVFGEKLTGTIETIAKDVKLQIEFNPGKVKDYRLIGYANRRLKNEDFTNDKIDAGDVGAGHTVTAFYEVIPADSLSKVTQQDLKYQKQTVEENLELVPSDDLLTVKFRYKKPDGDTSIELSEVVEDVDQSWQAASDDFRFASSVALWGMLLRNSEYAGEGNIEMVRKLALSGRGEDTSAERAGFLDLVRQSSSRR